MKRLFTLAIACSLAAALLTGACAQQVWPKTVPAPAADPNAPFVFVVFGDNRPPKADAPQPPIYAEIIKRVNETGASFVINSGDLIFGSGDPDVMSRQLDGFIAVTDALKAPCYVAYGNHEQGSAAGLALVEKRIGPRYFAFNYGNSRFYLLNTEMPGVGGQIAGEQLAWLKQDLAEEGARQAHRFVFFHRPMFSPMNDAGARKWGDPENLASLQKLFTDSKVEAVINGHDHYFAWRMVDGVTYIVSGGAGAPSYQSPGGYPINHFILVKVDGSKVSMSLVPVSLPAAPAPPK